MNTVLEQTTAPGTIDHMRVCARCGIRYDWRRSPSSSLKMTYCGSLCEQADLGFTIEAILRSDFPKRETMPTDRMLDEALAEIEALEAQQAVDEAVGSTQG